MKKAITLFLAIMLVSIGAFAKGNLKDTVNTSEKTPISLNTLPSASMTADQKKARLEAITARFEQIKSLDFKTLSHQERKALRLEVKALSKEAKVIDPYSGTSNTGFWLYTVIVVAGIIFCLYLIHSS